MSEHDDRPGPAGLDQPDEALTADPRWGDLDADPALASAILEIEQHLSGDGWDQPAAPDEPVAAADDLGTDAAQDDLDGATDPLTEIEDLDELLGRDPEPDSEPDSGSDSGRDLEASEEE